MVKEKEINGKKYYQCEACLFFYETEKLAQDCEDFCNKHHACSTEITKHAVEIKEDIAKIK